MRTRWEKQMRSARHIAIAEEYQRHDPLSTYVYSHGKDISMLAQVANDAVKLYLVYELVRSTLYESILPFLMNTERSDSIQRESYF